MEKLKEVVDDLFDIAARVKGIDDDYKIYFNEETRRYELHNVRYRPTYQLTFPQTTLDAAALNHVRLTRIERIEDEVRKLDEFNARLERQKNAVIKERAEQRCEDVLRK